MRVVGADLLDDVVSSYDKTRRPSMVDASQKQSMARQPLDLH